MNRLRLLIGVLVVVLLLAASSVIAGMRPHSIARVNLIATVGAEGVVKTMHSDGSHIRRISPDVDGFFTWPTWSPNANTLVYSGVVGSADELQLNLYAADINSGVQKALYEGEPGDVGLLAQGVLHYPLWSPDSSRLAFIASSSDSGLSLFMDDLDHSPTAQHLLDNGPLWMSWSEDASTLAVHRGSEHFLVDLTDSVAVNRLNIRAVGYRVPAWKPASDAITLVTQRTRLQRSVSTARVTEGTSVELPVPVQDVRGEAAFLWSPTGQHLAVADSAQYLIYRGSAINVYRGVAIVSEDAQSRAVEVRKPVLAFFWSPDASKLAYVTLSQTEGALRWGVVDVASGEQYPLVDFIPSRDQQALFQFFDQYAYSHSPWSPHSSNLVFAGSLINDATAASVSSQDTYQTSRIIVVGASHAATPQTIADGVMGFWSPR